MALKFYESPFHVTHGAEIASKMAMKMDLSIMITNLIKEKGWTQKEAAEKLGISQSRVSELKMPRSSFSLLTPCSTCWMHSVSARRCRCQACIRHPSL
nr:helix-turn-helix domain-containing protein [Pectobacterium sp. PL152]